MRFISHILYVIETRFSFIESHHGLRAFSLYTFSTDAPCIVMSRVLAFSHQLQVTHQVSQFILVFMMKHPTNRYYLTSPLPPYKMGATYPSRTERFVFYQLHKGATFTNYYSTLRLDHCNFVYRNHVCTSKIRTNNFVSLARATLAYQPSRSSG